STAAISSCSRFLNVYTEFILTMVPEGPPRGSYCASWLRLSLYHNKAPCSLNIMKSYRIEGHRLPMFTFNEVANINIGGQSAQRRVSAATPPLASSHAAC